MATPQYIVNQFGVFGVPTMKYQLIIAETKRKEITGLFSRCLFFDDTHNMTAHTQQGDFYITDSISTSPQSGKGSVSSSVSGLSLRLHQIFKDKYYFSYCSELRINSQL